MSVNVIDSVDLFLSVSDYRYSVFLIVVNILIILCQ